MADESTSPIPTTPAAEAPAPAVGTSPAASFAAAPQPVVPPAPQPAGRTGDPVPTGWVIAAVILFWPTAIPALLASHRAARAAGAGDVAVAVREGANAKRWGVISVCVGVGLAVLSVLVSIAWVVLVAVAWHDHHGLHSFQDGRTHELPFDRQGGPNGNDRNGNDRNGGSGSNS